ncbi:NUDIX hydrolase [Pseudomonas sp. MF4836]|uniref:NUDIX hydrolase n=1 Tax=Pseudomonas sp. MF4836 TaxID=1960827 RepID=UPI000996E366|nr:NUDIX domain-containing protein [Pseudomonas sp. MF4836]OOV92200.1 DNA mismatch repair protein MutT [Pseudomonas sp. MF4836]
MSRIDKACPVVLRHAAALQVLAFAHPLAGLQLVKGSLEPGEASAVAAVRELAEEAGIKGEVIADLGLWVAPQTGQRWAFHQCRVAPDLPDTWTHFAADDGGHEFRFFWHPLASEPSAQWHPLFQGALAFLRQRLGPI